MKICKKSALEENAKTMLVICEIIREGKYPYMARCGFDSVQILDPAERALGCLREAGTRRMTNMELFFEHSS